MPTVKESCRGIYNNTYNTEKDRLYAEALASSRSGEVSEEKLAKIETEAQKEAIKQATVDTMRAFPNEESETSSEESSSSIPMGNQVGEKCYQGTLSIVDSTGIKEDTLDVIADGKITVINFWGTWCTPCVNELPYFDRIATEYEDSVSVVAIHTNMVVNTAGGYIAEHYPESKIQFACDDQNEAYYNKLGGRGTSPYTLVVDENGIIAAVFVQSWDYEDLKEIVESLLAD